MLKRSYPGSLYAQILAVLFWCGACDAQSLADQSMVEGTSPVINVFEQLGFPQGEIGNEAAADPGKGAHRVINLAGGDVLRSFLTLPGAADPNSITPSPFISRDFHQSSLRPEDFVPPPGGGVPATWTVLVASSPDDPSVARGQSVAIRPAHLPRVRKPHLWAGLGAVVGGLANAHLSGYRLSEFDLRFNSLQSERVALREQGADFVQHFILGYGLTRYFLDNGSRPLSAGVSAFAYEFLVGEVFESFPQAGGISVRDLAFDLVAVTVGVMDHEFDSPFRFRAGSRTDVRLSTPNEFDPFRISLGVAVAQVAGLEIVASVQNWKDRVPTASDPLWEPRASTSYLLSNH